MSQPNNESNQVGANKSAKDQKRLGSDVSSEQTTTTDETEKCI
jgi:hypothetical protein